MSCIHKNKFALIHHRHASSIWRYQTKMAQNTARQYSDLCAMNYWAESEEYSKHGWRSPCFDSNSNSMPILMHSLCLSRKVFISLLSYRFTWSSQQPSKQQQDSFVWILKKNSSKIFIAQHTPELTDINSRKIISFSVCLLAQSQVWIFSLPLAPTMPDDPLGARLMLFAFMKTSEKLISSAMKCYKWIEIHAGLWII